MNQYYHYLNKSYKEANYKNLPVYAELSKLSGCYLSSIEQVLASTLKEHPRTFVIRIDLHFPQRVNCPDYPYNYESGAITRFISSLKAKISHNQGKSAKSGKRVHATSIKYIWAKEIYKSLSPHYHLALLVNADAYRSLGNMSYHGGNMINRIKQAWASALSIPEINSDGLVHIPDNPTYKLDINASNFSQVYADVFYRLSYLAKLDTKDYGNHSRSFGCSQN
jgi:hypothetical protein